MVFYHHFNFNNIQENTIYIPEGNDHVGGINDQIAYGTFDVMKKYNNILLNVKTLMDNNLSIFHPESLHSANIQYHKIIINRVLLPYFFRK